MNRISSHAEFTRFFKLLGFPNLNHIQFALFIAHAKLKLKAKFKLKLKDDFKITFVFVACVYNRNILAFHILKF